MADTQVAAVDMAAFVMECERLSTKLLSGNTLADVEAIRDRASIVQSFRSKEQSASTTQSTSWFRQKLRDFFDDKLLVPYESTVVLVRRAVFVSLARASGLPCVVGFAAVVDPLHAACADVVKARTTYAVVGGLLQSGLHR